MALTCDLPLADGLGGLSPAHRMVRGWEFTGGLRVVRLFAYR
jgi:hypothetical protein